MTRPSPWQWRKYSAEEKIRIVLEDLRGEESIAELSRREGVKPNMCYEWSMEFMGYLHELLKSAMRLLV